MIGVVVNSTYDDKIGLMDDAATVKIGLDDIVFDAFKCSMSRMIVLLYFHHSSGPNLAIISGLHSR